MVIKKYTLQFEALALCSLPRTYKQLWPCQRYMARVYIFAILFNNSQKSVLQFCLLNSVCQYWVNLEKSILVKIYTTCREGLSWPWNHVHHKRVSVGPLLELIRLLPQPAQRYFFLLSFSISTFIEQARAWREGRLAKLPCSSSPCQQYWSCGCVLSFDTFSVV